MATRHQVRQSVISLLYAFELNSQNISTSFYMLLPDSQSEFIKIKASTK